MKDALTTALSRKAGLVFAREAADLQLLRAAADEQTMVLLIVGPDVSHVDKAMLLAGVGALAVALAPRVRIAALNVDEGADVVNVVKAGRFLADAVSTTGQILRITAR